MLGREIAMLLALFCLACAALVLARRPKPVRATRRIKR